MNPVLLAAVGVIGLSFAVLALIRPRICLVALVTLDITGLNGVIAEHVGVSMFWPMVLLSLLALLALVRRGRFRFRWSPVILGVLVLYAGFCLSLVNAADPVAAQAALIERGRDLVVFAIVLALLLSTGGAGTLVRSPGGRLRRPGGVDRRPRVRPRQPGRPSSVSATSRWSRRGVPRPPDTPAPWPT